MSAEQNKEVARRFFEDFCTGRRAELADELLTANHVYHDPQTPPGMPQGAEGMRQIVAIYQNGLDGHWQIEDLYAAEDDHVVCRWTGTGTHKTEVMGIPPTGKKVRVDALSLLRLEGGKIAENWTAWDTLGLLQQLGVVPAPGAAAD